MVTGNVLALPEGSKVRFWIKAPAIRLSDHTPSENLAQPIARFIHDWAMEFWDFPSKRFLTAYQRGN